MKRMDIDGSRRTVVEVLGLTALRAVVGVIMAAHGFQKLLEYGAWHTQVAQLGIPVPAIAAPLAMVFELLGGLCLIVGFGTRIAALAVACVLVTAILTVHLEHGLFTQQGGFEFPLALLASALYIMAAGGGPISIDALLRRRARRQALINDRRWREPPYVPVPDEAVYQRQRRDELPGREPPPRNTRH